MKKIDNINDIHKILKNKNYIYDEEEQKEEKNKITRFTDDKTLEKKEEEDKLKSKILRYIYYKKRSESEIKRKFSKDYDRELLDNVINELKEKGYINDNSYIKRTIDEFIAIKNLSLKEVRYKLMSKGISPKDIDKYFDENYDELLEYEINSAKTITSKKIKKMDEQSVKNYLYRKGYKTESIEEAIENNAK